MPLLNNELFDSEHLIQYITSKIDTGKPIHLRGLQTNIKNLYFANNDGDVGASLQADPRFSDYGRLRELLKYLLSLPKETSDEVVQEGLSAFKENMSDWRAEKAHEQFGTLNAKYSYFGEDEATQRLFLDLAKASRAMITFIECNNTPQDTMAYEYAYKMMALCVKDISDHSPDQWFKLISQKMNKLIRTFPNKEIRPYHETLLTHLTLPHASDIQDRAGWITFIQEYGVKAFPAFASAKKIEAKNHSKAPSDMNDAKHLLAACLYTRANEDIDFAQICHQYRIAETTFNSCLDYMKSGWPKKIQDNIPNITIEQGNFTWSKLPVEDKRALIIGKITDCCQSIDGHSRQCVKDYVSLPNNGLYILKDKNKIIGQAYVWLSKAGNLCMDSVECLTNSISDEQLRNLLDEFAQTVLQQHPSITRVNLGTGGKTPERLYSSEALIPEQIRTGHFYGDAESQFCIDRRPPPLTKRQLKEWNKQLSKKSNDIQACFNYLCEHLHSTVEVITTLTKVLKDPSLIRQINFHSIQRFLSFSQSPKLEDLQPISLENLKALPEDEKSQISTARLVWNKNTSEEILQILPFVQMSERFKVVMDKNIEGETLLHKAVNHSDLLKVILELLPEEVRLVAVTEKNKYHETPLLIAVRKLESLKVILELLPMQDRLLAVKKIGNTLLHNPESLKVILTLLPKEQRLSALNAHILHELIYNKPDLLDILALLPEQARLSAVNGKNSSGRTLLHQILEPELLKAILELLPESDRFLAINEKNQHGETVLHQSVKKPLLLKTILAFLPKDKFFSVFDEKSATGNTVLYDATQESESFNTILEFLPEEERFSAIIRKNENGSSVLDRAVKKLISLECFERPVLLQSILTLLPNEVRLSVLKEKTQNGRSLLSYLISNPDLLEYILQLAKVIEDQPVLESLETILALLPEEERLWSVKEKNKYGNTILYYSAHYLKSLKAILAIYPVDERLSAIKERDAYTGDTVLHKVSQNPALVKAILELLPENARLPAVKEKNNNGHTLLSYGIHNIQLFIAILALLPESERLSIVKEKDRYGDTVLHRTINNFELFKSILELLPDKDRLLAVKEKNKQGKTVLGCLIKNPDTLKATLKILQESYLRLSAAKEKSQNNETTQNCIINNNPEPLNSSTSTKEWGFMTSGLQFFREGLKKIHKEANTEKETSKVKGP